MGEVHSRGERIDRVTTANELNKHGQLQSVGGVGYLASLDEGLGRVHNLEGYAAIVKQKATYRRICATAQLMQDCASLEDGSPGEIIAKATESLAALEGSVTTTGIDDLKSIGSSGSRNIQFVADRMVAEGAITAITAGPGDGKSTLLSALLGAVTTGEPFAGRNCSQRKALICDCENTRPVLNERLARVRVQDGGDLKIWDAGQNEEAPGPGDARLRKWILQNDPRPVVAFDSCRGFLDGDENDSNIVRAFGRQLRGLADLGAAVILLHHTGKGESSRDYRGSSDFKAFIDVGYSLTNFGDGQLGKLRLKAFKARFTVDNDFILHYVNGQFLQDDRSNSVKRTVTEQLAELLHNNPGIRSKEFEDLADKRMLGRNRGRQFLEDGIAAGEIRRQNGPKNSKLHFLIEVEP